MKIKSWKKYQHYKHRSPPWIKLHRTLLDDKDFFLLSGDASKVLAYCLLLASEDETGEGELPDVETMSFRLRIPKETLKPLILELKHWIDIDDSEMLAPCKQNVTTETETETESEKETESERESHASAREAAALPPENRQIQDLKNFKLSNGEPDPKEMASVMDAYVSKIKFAPKSSKNLYFVENCLRHLKISEIIDSIEKMAHKYKIENTPSRFKLSPERFFDAEHIRHVLSDNFEICPPKSSETASLTEGQEWEKRTRQNMVDSGNTSFDNESKISPIDALDLIRSYLDRWRYGLRPDMCERWLRWLTGCDKAPIAKAFDALLQECEKPFPFKRLSELSIKYMSNNEALENVKKWKKEQTSEV